MGDVSRRKCWADLAPLLLLLFFPLFRMPFYLKWCCVKHLGRSALSILQSPVNLSPFLPDVFWRTGGCFPFALIPFRSTSLRLSIERCGFFSFPHPPFFRRTGRVFLPGLHRWMTHAPLSRLNSTVLLPGIRRSRCKGECETLLSSFRFLPQVPFLRSLCFG